MHRRTLLKLTGLLAAITTAACSNPASDLTELCSSPHIHKNLVLTVNRVMQPTRDDKPSLGNRYAHSLYFDSDDTGPECEAAGGKLRMFGDLPLALGGVGEGRLTSQGRGVVIEPESMGAGRWKIDGQTVVLSFVSRETTIHLEVALSRRTHKGSWFSSSRGEEIASGEARVYEPTD